MKTSVALAGFLSILAVSGTIACGQSTETTTQPDRVSAPVVYKDLMLILSTEEGVAAIDFEEPIEQGVRYRFRYFPVGDAAETTGTGRVFEKYKRFPNEAGGIQVVDDSGQLWIEAGEIRVEWSFSGSERGWIYYAPEKTRVQIANSDKFADVQLRRFAWSTKADRD